MYKPKQEVSDQVWDTWCGTVNDEQLYRCREHIKCDNGEFEKDDLVVLSLLSLVDSIDGEIRVTDFNAYAKRLISDNCNSFTNSELQFDISDTITISLKDFENLFEPISAFAGAWKHYLETSLKRQKFRAVISILLGVSGGSVMISSDYVGLIGVAFILCLVGFPAIYFITEGLNQSALKKVLKQYISDNE